MNLQELTRSKHFKQTIIITFLSLSALTWLIIWIYGHYYISTDDAYVGANVVQIAPRISGQVNKLYVRNNQYVHEGDVLFEIDSVPYELAVNSAKAQVAMSEAQMENASITEKRTTTLVKQQYSSAQAADNAVTSLRTALANLQYAQTGLQQANLNLQYTKIVAPTSGWVTNVTLREGDVITTNQPLFALISDREFWVDANFKETEMAQIKSGQHVKLIVDMYPDHTFNGVIESIAGGAGAAFSLLPPQNATGNWVKVTQRVPVRIRVLDPDQRYPLRIGTSVDVTISLHNYYKQPISSS